MKTNNTQPKPEENPTRLKILAELENLDTSKKEMMQILIKGNKATPESNNS
jgi:hypothetical protein